jgi:hypothetical protein
MLHVEPHSEIKSFKSLQTCVFSGKAINFLFFLCFASVQNCETYPPARGRKQTKFKKQSCLQIARCMDVKQQKIYLLHLSTEKILKKEYK